LLKIRDGQAADEDLRMPARVLPSREFGAIVTAFEAACDQAVLAATEQTRVRSGYAEVFIDQFRRTQSLMQRQLYLIEQLELSEKSPELLSKLFQLDHLVTRMRRNNENMLVVSGTELARKPTEAASIESIIRSAMSEIEHYQRVELIDPPAGKIVASAGNDLVRMLAELIDNAASFSPPETAVTVRAYVRRDGSLSIAVVDNGVGMTDIKVREVNERLTRLGSNELARSRRVGLLVVGRLAGRHGIGVELLGGDTHTGVTALISVPSEFVIEAERPGWADRRHAMQAAARREAVLEATGVTRGAVQNSDGRNAPRTADMRPAKSIGNPLAPSLRTGSVLGTSLNNTASMDGVPRTAVSSSKIRSIRDAIDGRTWDLLERAHADVAEELPTRTPNPLIGRPVSGKDAAERVASAWFRARNTAGQRRSTSTAAGVDDATPDDWNDGWIVLDAPPRPETYEYTEDGLPVRERGAHLVPGSAKPKAGDATQTPRQPIPRDPAHTRSRLSSFQQGVRRAKAKATQTGKPRSTAERAR
jgi:signal transduction histidine kinase